MTTTIRRLLAMTLAMALLLTGCGKTADTDDNAEQYPYISPVAHDVGTAYESEDYGFQLNAPADGEEIAVLHTNFGDIAVRLFPDGAPKTVAAFKDRIRQGVYNDVAFHRIINDFMVQTGDIGDEDVNYIPDEFDRKLLNLRGALAMANPGAENQNGTQFFINQNPTNSTDEAACAERLTEYRDNYSEAAAAYKENYDQYVELLSQGFSSWEEYFHAGYYLAPLPDTVPAEVWELYDRQGGNISLDGAWRSYGGHTVFGQVFDGMEVVDAIAAIQTDTSDDSPLYEVTLLSAELVTYDSATYRGSGLLSPQLMPITKDEDTATEPDAATPLYPLGDAQTSTAHTVTDVYADRDYGFQLESPAVGEEIAVLHTTKGDIRVRLFPEGAPKTVANFTALVRQGYYNGLPFHHVMQDFVIQSGDPTGNGTGGESSTGAYIPDEFDRRLLNLRGALSMGNTGVQNTNTSQFFINQTTPSAQSVKRSYWTENETQYTESYDSTVEQYTSYYDQNAASLIPYYGSKEVFLAVNATLAPRTTLVPNAVWSLYSRQGGNIHLDGAWRNYGGNTVFGQVFDGMDVVDAIAAVPTDSDGRPTESVAITSAEIVIYRG